MRPLVLRLHFYAGVLIAPFLLVAALSGTLYAATPQLEEALYREQLHVTASATQLPLAEQVQAAVAARGGQAPVAVRPAPSASDTTRVLFSDPSSGESERTAVFVDPGTGQVRGQLSVYGTSGVLPLRTWVDQLHRNLHLGEPGRLYSELAASWLWVLALSGVGLWVARQVGTRCSAAAATTGTTGTAETAGTAGTAGDGGPAGRRGGALRQVLAPRGGGAGAGRGGRGRTRALHAVLGTWIAVGLLTLSATGLTWSTHAGARVTDLRSALSWQTPVVDTSLPGPSSSAPAGAAASGAASGHEGHTGHEGHADHEGHGAPSGDPGVTKAQSTGETSPDTTTTTTTTTTSGAAVAVTPAAFEQVLATAREAGLSASRIEVKAPAEAGAAWKVDEVDRSLHTQVDSAAIALTTTTTGQVLDAQVLDVVRFEEYPFTAKLARWGIDAHMGSFGWGNQLVLLVLGLGLSAVVVWGYRMWWQRRPDPARRLAVGPPAHRGAWRHLPKPFLAAVVVLTAAVGWALPLLGVSLLVFLVLDAVLGGVYRTRSRRPGDLSSATSTSTGGSTA
ncbi:PepSY-associated TM helix domain-containing protein [Kineococcus sp. SYSU DK005]|uniref:PepSY-associated TM helix domain-containing protein n=1 Tax=Kineococcus sp. SYSU DK005 TaxID=3383126 RepID=UPI003D7DB4CF